ncbi:MAG: sugar ABC transporter substrate-binding protein [Deltaproteobacteria bacterium]|nr:sugar ABC transporter substrate-binding protein [Deltaproteobacteria bacterium]
MACVVGCALGVASCRKKDGRLTVGVAFETLQTEYWVASFDIMHAELERNNIRMLEAISDGDANRQLEQVKSFVARRVDGIIVAPKDAHTVIPMIKAANRAGIPIVIYNRPPAPTKAVSVTIGTDNFGITKNTVEHMCTLARQSPAPAGKKHEALLVMGDLGDINAIGRRDGFDKATADCSDVLEVVSRVPSEWNQEKALAGVTNALQAHPNISFMFTSSDFLLPSIMSALKAAGKWEKAGHANHVILGAFDGDATAYEMLRAGYLDADGVQDAYFQSKLTVQAILDMRAGKPVANVKLDPGLVVNQSNLGTEASRMWGAAVAKQKAEKPQS